MSPSITVFLSIWC